MKKFTIALAAAAVIMAAPSASSAQAFPGNTANICTLDIFVSITPTKCAGFYSQNSIAASVDADGVDAFSAAKMNITGLPLGLVFLEKKDTWNGTASFSTTMYGLTVIGMHWGNYAGDPGNVSAFFLFDAGTTGINDFDLKPEFLPSISNAAIVRTGTPGEVTQQSVTTPEPSTYALMAAGLAALGFVARRRRNNA